MVCWLALRTVLSFCLWQKELQTALPSTSGAARTAQCHVAVCVLARMHAGRVPPAGDRAAACAVRSTAAGHAQPDARQAAGAVHRSMRGQLTDQGESAACTAHGSASRSSTAQHARTTERQIARAACKHCQRELYISFDANAADRSHEFNLHVLPAGAVDAVWTVCGAIECSSCW